MRIDPKNVDQSRLLPASVEENMRGALGRIVGVGLTLAAAAGWLCLITWSASDPSLMQATGAPVRNLLGQQGATAADILLQTLGFASAFGLVGPMIWGLELIAVRRVPGLSIKLCIFPMTVMALAGGCSALPVLPTWPFRHGFGGLLGDFVYNFIASLVATALPEKSGLIAGLGLFVGGLGSLTHSVGLSLRDIAGILPGGASRRRRATDNPMPPAAVQSSSDDELRIEPRLDAGQPFAAEPVLSEPPRAQVRPRMPEPAYEQQYEPRPQPAQPRAPAPQHDFDAIDAHDDPYAGHGDDDFDAETDLASRELARRFAPRGAAAEQTSFFRAKPRQREMVPEEPVAFDEPIADELPPVVAPSRPTRRSILAERPREAGFKRPSLNLLRRPAPAKPGAEFTQTVLRGNARLLEDVLADFGVKGEVKEIRPGPVVTLFEFEPARGTKTSRVVGLADDIARSMSAASVRVAVVPGRNVIGIELPNVRRESVFLREILESEPYRAAQSTLPLALGKAIGGEPVVMDLARMPHLLVAGTTGSGKSVGVNAMVLSLVYNCSPDDCRLLMIDPKMLELSVYNGIPHLLTPVVTDPQQAVAALNWVVREMEERYKRMAKLAVRNIEAYNNRVRNAKKRGEPLQRTVQTGFNPRTGQPIYAREDMELETMPNIVVVVDEFADLMIVAGKDVEAAIQRLAQMARAAGIHLIMATQRPSVDVVTGTIKANFPSRISFKVASKVDSRTILNEQGAEQLLGHGDMLMSSGSGQMIRVHGAFVSDEEVEAVAQALREQGEPRCVDGITDLGDMAPEDEPDVANDGDLYARAVALVLRDRKASTSYVQRRLSIGYNRAADLIERMEREGLIGPPNHAGKRDIFATADGRSQGAVA